jgi:hypothetical protein
MVLASDNLTYLPTPQLTTREQPFHTKHLPASYISRPYNEGHVTKVLERLREYGLYCKAEKCEFSVKKVGFLGFVISPDGIEMEADRIATIEDWPTPKSVKDVQVLMGFTNFYRRFVKKYAKVTAPITDLLKKPDGIGRSGNGPGKQMPHSRSSSARLPRRQFCSTLTRRSRSLSRQTQAVSR